MKQKKRNHSSSNIFDNNLIWFNTTNRYSINRSNLQLISIDSLLIINYLYIYRNESKMKKTHLNIFQEKKMTMMMLWTKVLNENSIINAHTHTQIYSQFIKDKFQSRKNNRTGISESMVDWNEIWPKRLIDWWRGQHPWWNVKKRPKNYWLKFTF